MKFQHQQQANGEWEKKTFLEQMAHIGSEVERTLNWKAKGDQEYSKMAFIRSLELFDLTLNSKSNTHSQIKEVARTREAWVDFAYFDNTYNSTAEQWRKYFFQLLMAYKLKQTSTN